MGKLRKYLPSIIFFVCSIVIVLYFINYVSTLDKEQTMVVGVIAIILICGVTIFSGAVKTYFDSRKQLTLDHWF